MAENIKTKQRISIGYALPPNKVKSIILPSLLTHAKHQNIDLIHIDLHQPLLKQGPFDCIIHKLYDENWNHQLLDFQSKDPHIPIIDSPAAIRRLHNRVSMLDAVNNLTLPPSDATFGIPNQILLTEENDVENLGLKFPVIAKPVIANGTLKSHQMSLVLNSDGLKKVKQQQQQQSSVVLQEFVNHGGVLFKVYVAGNHVKCVGRKSLPDINLDHAVFGMDDGVIPFSQISNLPAKSDEQEELVRMPPLDFVNGLAAALREATGVHLFNFDVIRDESDCIIDRFLVIDINYFPGYAKLPGFEAMLTDFLLDVVRGEAVADQNS